MSAISKNVRPIPKGKDTEFFESIVENSKNLLTSSYASLVLRYYEILFSLITQGFVLCESVQICRIFADLCRYVQICRIFADLCRYVQICRIFADLCRDVQIRKKTDTLRNAIKTPQGCQTNKKMFKTGKKSHLCQNDEKSFCSNLYRSVEITDLHRSLQSQTMTNKLP